MVGVSISEIRWNAQGLVPAVAQQCGTGRVLMVAWMNREALKLTLSTGVAHYWSRSRRALWKKGETSGHFQHVEDLRLDCDRDTVLLRVRAEGGVACHTGRVSCFFQDAAGVVRDEAVDSETVLTELMDVIEARRGADPNDSWTARLLERGLPKICAKVSEESEELIAALEGESDERVISEAADLVYHAMVGLASRGLRIEDVSAELGRRFGVGGLAEKASRTP